VTGYCREASRINHLIYDFNKEAVLKIGQSLSPLRGMICGAVIAADKGKGTP
jgi:hypothetical protein